VSLVRLGPGLRLRFSLRLGLKFNLRLGLRLELRFILGLRLTPVLQAGFLDKWDIVILLRFSFFSSLSKLIF
jgi:hypothetical protein